MRTTTMFTAALEPWGPWHLLRLKNETTGSYVSFIPDLGAALNELVLPNAEGVPTAVTLGSADPVVYQELGCSTYWGTQLFPFPNRINGGQYSFSGQHYQLPLNHAAEGHAIHGLVYDQPFVVQKLEATEREAHAVLGFQYQGQWEWYPFPFYLEVEIWFSKGLRIRNTVVNTGQGELPCGLGWHPYFSFGADSSVNDWEVLLPVTEELLVGPNMIPTGERKVCSPGWLSLNKLGDTQLDTCFAVIQNQLGAARTEIKAADKSIHLAIVQEAGADLYNYLQVYSPPGRTALAIEPMTCPPDAFNNGEALWTLSAGEQKSASWWVEAV